MSSESSHKPHKGVSISAEVNQNQNQKSVEVYQTWEHDTPPTRCSAILPLQTIQGGSRKVQIGTHKVTSLSLSTHSK